MGPDLRKCVNSDVRTFHSARFLVLRGIVIALGVDPGTRRLGWGVVTLAGNRMRHVAHGVIAAHASLSLAERLAQIDGELTRIIALYQPEVGSVETIFFHKDAQAAAKLGHARGVVLLNLARAKVAVFEYPPAHVKRVITGKGQADKRQMALMIRALLALDEAPPSDAADALALAVTHLRRAPLEAALRRSSTPIAFGPRRPRTKGRGWRGAIRLLPA